MRDGSKGNVAWDIETTGFSEDCVITVVGFYYPNGHASILINTNGETIDDGELERSLQSTSNIDVTVVTAPNEEQLLSTTGQHLFDTFDRDYNRLIAYNAESWNGGFDLPFIRRRCLYHDQTWMFKNIRFTDLWEVVQKRVNTTVVNGDGETEDVNDLVGAHRVLCNPSQDIDPFDDSKEAVECFEDHEFYPLACHNLADVVKTWELGESLKKVVSPRDWSEKSL